MSAPSPPPDNSYAIEMSRQQAAKEAQAAADAKEAAHKQELAGLRTSARGAATGNVNQYFSDKGLDPSQYSGSIESQLNDILSGISQTDENPGAAFTGAGQSIWDRLTSAAQAKAMTGVNQTFAPNFESSRVPETIDDPYIQSIESEQYANADKIIKNMLNRGVLTSTGYNAAKSDLDSQVAGVNSRLGEIGTGLWTKERSALTDIANRARQTAGNLQLGSTFDPSTYSTEADTSLNNFISSLGNNIRAAAPGSLFNTAGLAAIGGSAQGPGNTAYNPTAASGTIEDPDSTDTSKANQSNPNSIF